MQRIVFNNFSQGLNNVIAPHLLNQGQATIFDNVDNISNTLKPLKDTIDGGIQAPYKPVYLNALVAPNQRIATTENLESQFGRIFSRNLVYYVDNNNIVSEAYGPGPRLTTEITATVNDFNFENIRNLIGRLSFETVTSDGTRVTQDVIDANGDAINAVTAWYSNVPVVHAIGTDGTEQTGLMQEVANAQMPYIVGSDKFAYELNGNTEFMQAPSGNNFKINFTPINFNVIYTRDGVRVDIQFIDRNGNGVDINNAIIDNQIIVTNADSSGITTNYAQGNVAENLPFIFNGQRYSFSTTLPAGYLSATDAGFRSTVTYTDTNQNPTAVHTYAVTLYNERTGQETGIRAGSPLTITPSILGATLRVIFGPDPEGLYTNFTKVRIYRISGPFTNYRFVAEVDYADSITYVDNILDANLGDIVPSADWVGKPMFNGLERHFNRMFGFIGNELWYTLTDNPYSWSNFGTVYVEGDIVAIASVKAGLIIFTSNNLLYLLAGTNASSYTLRTISENTGFTGGLVTSNSIAYWVYENNIYSSNGTQVVNLTKNSFDLPSEAIVSTLIINEIIYLAYPNEIFKFDNGSIIRLPIAGATNLLAIGERVIYFREGRQFFLNESQANATFVYRSPDLVLTTIHALKEYEKVQVTWTGIVTIKIFIDDVEVVNRLLSGTTAGYNHEEVGIPNDNNKGNRMQVQLEGTGEVFEYVAFIQEVKVNG